MELAQRVLVTGGSRGIGWAIAERFAQAGMRVCIMARREETLEKALEQADKAGFDMRGVVADFADLEGIPDAVAEAVETLDGQLDGLVNNAGIFDMAPMGEVTREMWDRFLAINLTAPFLVTQCALPTLLKSQFGHIMQISSVAGRQGFPQNTVYCATKYGLRGLSDAMREEFRDQGLTVSTIYPGATNTDIFDGLKGEWDRSSMNLPEDVAEVAWRAWSTPSEDGEWLVPPRNPAP